MPKRRAQRKSRRPRPSDGWTVRVRVRRQVATPTLSGPWRRGEYILLSLRFSLSFCDLSPRHTRTKVKGRAPPPPARRSTATAACDGRQRVAMRRGACVRVDSDWLLAPGSRCERNPSARAQVAGRARASSEAAGASLPRTRADGTRRDPIHRFLVGLVRHRERGGEPTSTRRRVVAPSRRRAVVRSRRRVVVTHGGRRGTDGGHTSRRRVVALSSRTGEGGEPTSTRVASSRRDLSTHGDGRAERDLVVEDVPPPRELRAAAEAG